MFDDFFDIVLADTTEGKKEHFNIRYKVYCEEMGFEPTTRFPDRQEKDDWDENSIHFLIRHRQSKQWIGAMRLVINRNNALPLSSLFDQPLTFSYFNSAEISRLCIVKEIRRRMTDGGPPIGLSNEKPSSQIAILNVSEKRKMEQSLIWGLFRAASLYCEKNQIKDWYFLCERALSRLIKKEGFIMTQIGEACEHRGKRYPFKMNVQEILNNPFWNHDYKRPYLLYSQLEDCDLPLSFKEAA